ncbi:1-acyl-sn-glycerol-3-phosphate acyltransferase [Pedobacter sp. SYSU D00535]|uniref:lysophospholipid acyltransferase family protein n=1 Tax=Pedobacter sp. SYSU D00535 TaxID=2810308 RepID=UPI001A962E87|nr:lysophospholipid acyltransferase family protein [Pedobacter sp. SYSU D00535]
MKLFFRKLHRYFYIASVALFFALLYPVLYYFSRKPERYTTLNHVRRFYAFISSAFAGLFYKYHYEKPLDWSRNYIFCSNHTSNLDITALTLLVKKDFAFLGKDELLNNPITGLWFKTIDIPINRESKISAFKAFKKTEEYLKNGFSMVIFPEGKIGDEYPPQLHLFKNGPFRLAIEQKVAIVPVTVPDIYKKMWDDGSIYGSKPGISHICVHAPIETTGLTIDDADALRDRVYETIQAELTKHEVR